MRQVFGAMERNHHAVLSMFSPLVDIGATVVEFGAGPGAHGALFCRRRPDVTWIPTDLGDRFESVRAWSDYMGTPNVADSVVVDLLNVEDVPKGDVAFCMNTIHIASPSSVTGLFDAASVGGIGTLFLYGPFRFRSVPLEASNERFDGWLRSTYPDGGLRVFEEVDDVAQAFGFELRGRAQMPANNHAFWWEATASSRS